MRVTYNMLITTTSELFHLERIQEFCVYGVMRQNDKNHQNLKNQTNTNAYDRTALFAAQLYISFSTGKKQHTNK